MADQLRLSGHVLQALECGRMPMSAGGYLEVVAWVLDALGQMPSSELHRLRPRVPGSLQNIVENVLHARRDSAWAADAIALHAADLRWAALRDSL